MQCNNLDDNDNDKDRFVINKTSIDINFDSSGVGLKLYYDLVCSFMIWLSCLSQKVLFTVLQNCKYAMCSTVFMNFFYQI